MSRIVSVLKRRVIQTVSILALLFGLYLPLIVTAGHVPTHVVYENSDEGDANNCPGGVSCCVSFGPVEFRRGSEILVFDDLISTGLMDMRVNRRYDSKTTYDSPMGFGWSQPFDVRIYAYNDGSVTLRRTCGEKQRFLFVAGAFVTPPGIRGELTSTVDGGWEFTDKEGVVQTFDADGKVIEIRDTNGNRLILEYDVRGRLPLMGVGQYALSTQNPKIVSYDYRLTTVTENNASNVATGRTLTFTYDETTGRLITITDDGNRAVSYLHDTRGNLTKVTDVEGVIWDYGYNDPNDVHNLTDVPGSACANCGNVNALVINEYDPNDKVVRQVRGLHETVFAYDTVNGVTTMTETVKDDVGAVLRTDVSSYTVSAQGFVREIIDPLGNKTVIERDTRLNVIRREVWDNTGTVAIPNWVINTITEKTYDALDNMLTETVGVGAPEARTTTYTYTPTNKIASISVPSVVNAAQSKVTIFIHNAQDLVETKTKQGFLADNTFFSDITTYGYDANGKVTSIDGPRTDVSDITTFLYDAKGNLSETTLPGNLKTTYTNYTASNQPGTVTDPNNVATTFVYDSFNRVKDITIGADTTSFTYTDDGKLQSITMPETNSLTFIYDTLGYVTQISDSLGNTLNYAYDSKGNRINEENKDPTNVIHRTLSYQYDALNRLAQINLPDTSQSTIQNAYDALGNRTSFTDANTNTTDYVYDALQRLKTMTQPGAITTNFDYDAQGNLTLVTDGNSNSTTYTYDDRGHLAETVSPDSGTTAYTYDPAGNLKTKTDANSVIINYTYDALNRLTLIDYPTDTDISYGYDTCINGKPRLCTITDQAGTTAYEYDNKGQITKDTKVINAVTYITQYSYDGNGNLSQMTYPNGRTATYAYNTANQISQVDTTLSAVTTTLASTMTYKPFGGMTGMTYGNGLNRTLSYDQQYRIEGIQTGAAQDLGYLFDPNGNITDITNNLDALKNKNYTYDTLNRLTDSTGPWGTLGWTYDNVGNRLTQVLNTATDTYTYTPNSNKIADITGGIAKTYGHDAAGNRSTENTRTYTYNQNNRMIQASDGATNLGQYTYNALGQRATKTESTVTTVYHYDLAGNLIAETQNDGTLISEYVTLYNTPLVKVDGTTLNYVHTDHLSSPQQMTDGLGAVVWEIETNPFGDNAIITGAGTNNQRFPGQYFDQQTGFSYNYFRYYQASVGRYLTSDPIGLLGGINPYSYVANHPVNLTDYYGLFTDAAGGVAIVSTLTGSALVVTATQVAVIASWATPVGWALIGVGAAATLYSWYSSRDSAVDFARENRDKIQENAKDRNEQLENIMDQLDKQSSLQGQICLG